MSKTATATIKTAAYTRTFQLEIATLLESGDFGAAITKIEELLRLKKAEKKKGWIKMGKKIVRFLSHWEKGVIAPEFSIFAKGNGKLPFWHFSSLALASCPGAKECKEYCYSLKGWRYPAAFFRQVQNYIIQSTPEGMELIEARLKKLTQKGSITLRLFVDGDFVDTKNVVDWFGILERNKDAQAYGYSKSLKELKDACREVSHPSNYLLNLSNGGMNPEIAEELPDTLIRGRFIAVKTARKLAPKQWGTREARKMVWEHTGSKVFVCPGDCGACTGSGHACGNPKIRADIAIPIH